MIYTLHNEPDYQHDSVQALCAVYQDEWDIAGRLAESLMKDGGDCGLARLEGLVGPSGRLLKNMRDRVELTGGEAELLFSKRDEAEEFIKAVFTYEQLLAGGIDDKGFAIMEFMSPNEDTSPEYRGISGEKFFEWVDGLGNAPGVKYDLLRLYHGFEGYRQYALSRLQAAAGIIKESIHEFEGLIGRLNEGLEADLSKYGVKYIDDKFHIRLEDGVHYDIYPSLAMPNGASVCVRDEIGHRRIHIGVALFDLIAMFREKKEQSADYNSLLKALSDGTKMSILMLLRQGSRYGAELAEELKLTSPTISHHMNALLQLNMGIVSIEKAGNRVYYSLNKSALRELLEGLARELCD